MPFLLHALVSLGVGFVFMSLGLHLIALEPEGLARTCSGWTRGLPAFPLKLLGLAATLAGLVVIMPGIVPVPAGLLQGAGIAMALIMAVPAIRHLRHREPRRLAANLLLATLAQLAVGNGVLG